MALNFMFQLLPTKLLGARLEEMINEDKQQETYIGSLVMDENKQKELLVQDEEEDFLDEGSTRF